jgi:hypothetical protein
MDKILSIGEIQELEKLLAGYKEQDLMAYVKYQYCDTLFDIFEPDELLGSVESVYLVEYAMNQHRNLINAAFEEELES